MTDQSKPVQVEQCDVDAAAAFLRRDDVGFAAKVTIVPDMLAEAFARHRLNACRSDGERGRALRVSIARIIDPSAWRNEDGYLIEQAHSDEALAKADLILAAIMETGHG